MTNPALLPRIVTTYAQTIRSAIARTCPHISLDAGGVALIEDMMRVRHSTLDGLRLPEFDMEAVLAVQAIMLMGEEMPASWR